MLGPVVAELASIEGDRRLAGVHVDASRDRAQPGVRHHVPDSAGLFSLEQVGVGFARGSRTIHGRTVTAPDQEGKRAHTTANRAGLLGPFCNSCIARSGAIFGWLWQPPAYNRVVATIIRAEAWKLPE